LKEKSLMAIHFLEALQVVDKAINFTISGDVLHTGSQQGCEINSAMLTNNGTLSWSYMYIPLKQ